MRRIALAVLALALAGNLAATETRRWTVDTAEQMLKGKGNGVAVTEDGRLVPVPGWQPRAKIPAPVVLAGVTLGDGSILVGTGHPAALYRFAAGAVARVVEVPAEQVTAMLRTPAGHVLVATTGPAAVFEWDGKKLVRRGGIEGGGFWDLAWFGGGAVVAAGSPATLYRLTDRGLERWLELPDTHARCLAVDGDVLLVGTSGRGLVLRVDGAGSVGMVADSPFTEIADLAVAPDGDVWAAAVVGPPEEKKAPAGAKTPAGKAGETVTVTPAKLKLPKVNGTTASSELLRVTPSGALLSVHRFAGQVATALAWDGSGVLVGTGYEGEVWRFGRRGGTRLAFLDAVQVTAILDGGRVLLTQGPAAVLTRRPLSAAGGTFSSAVERFKRPVAFGRYRVDPPEDAVRIRFRSGLTQRPDRTWLPWSDWLPAAGGKVPLPPATSLQWEVKIPAGKEARAVERVTVAYREVNLPPRIVSLTVQPPGVVFLAAPPPSGQFVDVAHPDVNGIFTTLSPGRPGGRAAGRGKKYWRVGYRTVTWKVEDPNGDPLRFDLTLERRDGFILPVKKGLERTQIAIDTTAVPDGWYRFRLVATDAPRNPVHPATDAAPSPWFVVDHTPPELRIVRDGKRWRVEAADALSAISVAQWSRDGAGWHPLAPDDGLVDQRHEVFHFPAESGRHLVVVRVIDRHHNRAVASAVEE